MAYHSYPTCFDIVFAYYDHIDNIYFSFQLLVMLYFTLYVFKFIFKKNIHLIT